MHRALTDGWDGGDDLSELELVEDGGLTSGIETNHENPHLLLGEEAAEQLGEGEPHLGSCAETAKASAPIDPQRHTIAIRRTK